MKMMKLVCAVCVCVTLGVLVPAQAGEHTLFYTYTALSKPLDLPGVYEFTALGMLDDRELDYYSSVNQVKVPKQTWMKEKMEKDYWNKGTESRKSKEQWFKVNVEILMDRMRHNKSDLHVLQWRHGCVVDEGTDGNLTFLRGVDEYSYDGSEFLSFDEENSRWIAPVPAAELTKRKWDEVAILNQYTKGYLEKECVGWLEKFMDYGQEELRKHFPPEVYKFATKSLNGPGKLILTCMATGFYPADVQVLVRKSRTTLPEHLVTSSGVRPNGDGTYQLRKSVEIEEKEEKLYDCYVNHSALKEPIIKTNGQVLKGPNVPGSESTGSGCLIGSVIGVIVLAVVAGVVFTLYKRGYIANGSRAAYRQAPIHDGNANGHTNGQANGHANGQANGHANGQANGHANGQANGHTNGQANGHANGQANGHANGHGNMNGVATVMN